MRPCCSPVAEYLEEGGTESLGAAFAEKPGQGVGIRAQLGDAGDHCGGAGERLFRPVATALERGLRRE